MKRFRTAYADTKVSPDAGTNACAYAGTSASATASADVSTDPARYAEAKQTLGARCKRF